MESRGPWAQFARDIAASRIASHLWRQLKRPVSGLKVIEKNSFSMPFDVVSFPETAQAWEGIKGKVAVMTAASRRNRRRGPARKKGLLVIGWLLFRHSPAKATAHQAT